MTSTSRPLARRLVLVAAAAGLLHAAASAAWALGSELLLTTVGAWAVDAVREGSTSTVALLGAIAAVKAVAALVPVAVVLGHLRPPRPWRALSWTGGVALLLYGGVNSLVALLVLSGVLDPAGGYDRMAMIGHAFIWDPLFVLWGGALLGSLWMSRPQHG